MLIDTHAHLTWDSFKPDLNQVVQRAKETGVKTIINIGADIESSKQAADLECGEISCYSSVGLHPHESSRMTSTESIQQYIEDLEKIYQTNPEKIVAVGECGLDFFFEGNIDFTPSSLSVDEMKKLQIKLFVTQINLSKKLNLPLIVHSREAWEDIFVPELQGMNGVFHSFTGTEIEARKILDLGFYLGFTCIITYPKNEHLRQIIKNTPLDKILTETDCPYLPPQTQRGQRNEPANIVEIIKTIAEVKGISFNKVDEATYTNARQLFGI
ncbi:MAG: TatD family deoxyribonuclease [Armatimonadetes bacterium]|nr:MAG: TatD family deoxyribonuclease [Armatimonadota bacterium]